MDGIEILNARIWDRVKHYTDLLYARQQRKGLLHRDCYRLIIQDRNVFAAAMVAMGDADAHGHRRSRATTTRPSTKSAA